MSNIHHDPLCLSKTLPNCEACNCDIEQRLRDEIERLKAAIRLISQNINLINLYDVAIVEEVINEVLDEPTA